MRVKDVTEDGVGEFVVRRKETDARSAGQPAFSITRTIRSPARAGSVSGSVGGGVGLLHPWARLNPRVVFGPRGCCREGKYT
jgi:hypothetical protein